MKHLIGLAMMVIALGCIGCGGSDLAETCKNIEWQGRQCQALKRVEWAKKHGLPPETVKGYESLPEDAR